MLYAGDLLGRWHALRGAFAPFEFAAPALDPGLPETWDRSGLSSRAAYFLEQKHILTPAEFDALGSYYRAGAFKIAGITHKTVLGKVRDGLVRSARLGESREQAMGRIQRALTAAGLSPLEPWHADLVAHQTLAQAYGAASFEALTDDRVRGILPFFRYVTQADERVRPNHAVWHNRFFRRDDPVWRRIWPPNGFRCRCFIRGVTVTQVRDYGIRSSRKPSAGQGAPDPGFEAAPGVFLEAQAGAKAKRSLSRARARSRR